MDKCLRRLWRVRGRRWDGVGWSKMEPSETRDNDLVKMRNWSNMDNTRH